MWHKPNVGQNSHFNFRMLTSFTFDKKFEGRDRDGTSVSKKGGDKNKKYDDPIVWLKNSAIEFSSPSARPKKLIKQELNELRRERREVVHLENAIEKHTDTLSAHLKSFCAIWSLVGDFSLVLIYTLLNVVHMYWTGRH